MTSSIYICIKQFNARLGDELSLKVGDKVEVIADDSEYNDGWYMGKNLVNNEVGLYPNTFTQLLISDEAEGDLLRSRSRSRNLGYSPVGGGGGGGGTAPTGLGISGGSINTLTIPEHDPVQDLSKMHLSDSVDTDPGHNLNTEIDKALKEIKDRHPTPDSTLLSKDSLSFSTSTKTNEEIGELDPTEAITWSPKEVTTHFIRRGFESDVANKFNIHKITGDILFQLELAHLKELDINSFGTRFEVNKEIERLRGLIKKPTFDSRKNSQSTSSTYKDSLFNSLPTAATTLMTEERIDEKQEQPQQLMPSVILSPQETKLKQFQKTIDGIVEPALYSPRPDSFMSPRKAPQPPTSSSTSPLNTTFKFGGESNNNNIASGYMTRTTASERPSSSLYDSKGNGVYHKRAESNKRITSPHKRHSSLFSFLSGEDHDKKAEISGIPPLDTEKRIPTSATAPVGSKSPSPVDIDDVQLSPRKKPLPKIKTNFGTSNNESNDEQKSELSNTAPTSRLKILKSSSTQNFRNLTASKKSKTSAFTEGIRDVTPDEAIKSASYSGWMSKRSGNTLSWRSRYFTLHGTRLSYFTSLKDRKEKGLIDITAHKVLPISTDSDKDKYTALYASTTLQGSYCFKLVPPAPGFKKGLTFTQPKTHYFAVNTEEEMRGWMKALMTATIDIDDSVPVVSSCSTPVISLGKAQEMLAKAREETKLKDEELRAQGYIRVGDDYEDSVDSTGTGSINGTIISTKKQQPKVSLDQNRSLNSPTTPRNTSGTGFSSPYMLAGGVSSPRPQTPKQIQAESLDVPPLASPTMSFGDTGRPSSMVNSQQESAVTMSSSDDSKMSINASKDRSFIKKSEKLLAYSSDGSGNHTFMIKNKK